jgi:hypothetical protein
VKLFRRIVLAAVLPLIAIVLAAVFAPAGPPTVSAAGDARPAVMRHDESDQTGSVADRAACWLHSIVNSTREFIS